MIHLPPERFRQSIERISNVLTIVLFLGTIGGFSSNLHAQNTGVKLSVYDGIIIGGFVDEGGFLNFTGPNINYTRGSSRHIIGMLPSLRFKSDNGPTQNSFVTPNLGFGYTFSYRYLAIQIPLYYNAKTATDDGRWHIGIGVGLRLNEASNKTRNE